MVEAEVFDKVVSLDEAIKKFVKDGDTVFAMAIVRSPGGCS